MTEAAFLTRAHTVHSADEHTAPLFENRYLHKNGRVVWMEWATVVLPGDPLRYGVARDVTKRRAAQEDQAYLAAIVQASQDAIVGLSLDGTIRSWNIGAERLYGYSVAEAVGKPIMLIVPPELREEQQQRFLQELRDAYTEPFETLRIAKDGRALPVLITTSPIIDAQGQVVGVAGWLRPG